MSADVSGPLAPKVWGARRGRTVAAVVGVGAVAVTAALAATTVALGPTAQARPPAPTVAPQRVFAVLSVAQRPSDRVPGSSMRSEVDPASTRYLGATVHGRHWLGVSRSGDMCLMTLDASSLLFTSCNSVTSTTDPAMSMGDPHGAMSTLMPDGVLPVGRWVRRGPNLFETA